MTYNIENNGETAYLAQIRITLPDVGVLFSKTPSNCKLDINFANLNVMQCDLNNGMPIFRDTNTLIKIGIETAQLDGKELIINASVFSAGDESNQIDNSVDSIIPLKEFSNIEIMR